MTKRDENPLRNFLRPARRQIALAAVSVVALCLALTLIFVFASSYMSDGQLWILIVFLVLFPVVGFLTASSMILRQARRLAVSEKDGLIPWQVLPPENQRRKLNAEAAEIAEILSLPAEQLGDLRSAYVVAEDLILRKIEQEERTPLMRRVSLERMEFDAVLVRQEVIKCIDVTFLVEPRLRKEKIGAVLKKVEYLKTVFERIRPGTRLVLVLALVTQMDSAAEERLRSTVADAVAETSTDVEIHFSDFEQLQSIFTDG